MASERTDEPRGRRRRGGRTAVRLDTQALWARLALLNRSQNWLADQIGISSGYMSKLVTRGRAPSGRIRQRMLDALGIENFNELFRLDEEEEEQDGQTVTTSGAATPKRSVSTSPAAERPT